MTELPASIAREAKGIHQSLKELLKTKEPFDKEVDFQRKNLRRRYLNLLLLHPRTREAQDIENHLWMQTSYAFISSYKQRIAALDRAMQNQQRQQQQQASAPGQQPRTNTHHGVVEHRKLVQRFCQFLAEEEKFWTQLVLRLRRMFDLTEAQPSLVALGLMDNTPNIAETDGRNHFQFPPEDPAVSFLPATPDERQSRLAILSKALICLGDIARYRELYKENGGKREDGRRGRNRRGGAVDNPPRPKNYTKAQQCYEQARLLVPSEGNPSHQLAILASYKKDSFASLIHYYRALCVSQPYDTAAENLGTVLSKALEVWRQRMKRERTAHGDAQPSIRVRTENLQENIVVLHALWRLGMDKGIEKMRSISPKHDEKVSSEFYALVSDRHLSIDMISNTVVLSQGALWKHRMIRHTPAPHGRNHHPVPVAPGTSTLIEWGILRHLLDIHVDLLEVGKDELKDPPPMDGLDDLAQRISATFRRTLPALRIASKWLRANVAYIAQDPEFVAYQEKEHVKDGELPKKSAYKISAFSPKIRLFWETYAQFILALSQAFPSADLPALNAPLEEDMDMRGFLPLKKLMGEERKGENGGKPVNGALAREQVHPNVEQLMRISDLLDDAKYLANMENSPLMTLNNHIIFNPEAVEPLHASSHVEVPRLNEDPIVPAHQKRSLIGPKETNLDVTPQADPDTDDNMETTSLTDDDPVDAAFNTVLDRPEGLMDNEADEEDDEIVWDPRASITSPIVSPKINAVPFTPTKPLLSPQARSPLPLSQYQASKPVPFNIPAAPFAPTATTATTAEDLLNGMGLGASTNRSLPTKTLAAPQPLLLFGPESQNIWSASSDEKPFMFNASSGTISGNHAAHAYPTSPRQFQHVSGPSQDLSQQSMWMSSFPSHSQNSQQNYVGALPSASFARPPQMTLSTLGGGQRQQHQRIPSASAAVGYPFSHTGSSQQDSFAYSPPPAQLPIHRPQPSIPFSSGYLSQSLNHSLNQSLATDALSRHGGAPTQYFPSAAATFHSKQLSMHDLRDTQQNYLSPPMSQVWSNTG